ncbi:excinuclease ABC subunit UvrA [Paenimyroides baculatum]|uniref:UvrABC system protein A n=1 Tax=Paenimyroides baculatum TaxID=2608000 RepID=A0A5M6CQY7_9FLAO|nr:excinuclease ABC subunit UvrA [Paenimyroides baculatum]KAA5537728.1 excinuclease ABC subunit UvrA [Paenimyroides baculatum]
MKKIDFSKIDPKQNIIIKGAHLHNLKNLDVVIPRNKMVVITGLSGSGKSSLAFDTLYAEGQRRYVESLSSYARQFLGRINKPKVEYIKGIAPAVAIEQKVNTTNARSTVGTSTEIYDYLKLLYARIGTTFSPISGNEVKKHTVTDVIDTVKTFDEESKWLLLAPVYEIKERSIIDQLKIALQQGFARLFYKNETKRIDEFVEEFASKKIKSEDIQLIIDRLVVRHDEDFYNRLSDAVYTAFFEGKGVLHLYELGTGNQLEFNNKFELDGITFLEPNIHLFSFNNPYGACPKCDGFGTTIGIDEDLVIPNTALSVYENAVYPWRGESMSWYRDQLVNNSHKFDFPIHKPFYELTADQKQLVWEGNSYFTGLNYFFKDLEANNYKIQNRVLLSRYRGKTKCNVCNGKRLRPEANYVKVADRTISDLVDLPINELREFFKNIQLNEFESKVAKRLLLEINNRLQFLSDVGLDYLTINRRSSTLSGGESQRINLATSLGSSLVGSMYILDEPSIGLHSRDSEKLIEVLKDLRDLGNTVIIVEHDEDVMKAADQIIDIGPEAGVLGGKLMAQGTFNEILKADTLTAKYLNGDLEIEVPKKRRPVKNYIEVKGARENNLQNIDVIFPLDCLTMVSGVSGSGKSTLVKKILYPALEKHLTGASEKPGQFNEITGSFSHIKHIEYVDQNPIGKSSRSNPISYIKAYDDIRDLFAKQQLSKMRNYQPKHFSFNVEGGRCEVCKGDGVVTIEMQFMADVHLECETCKGKRFKKEILEVNFEGKNIFDVLNLTVDESMEFFTKHKQDKIVQKIQPLQDVGLGYVALGQSSSTLSGGEAQRVKLATFLGKGAVKERALFIFDEPTTGLHFHDIQKLLQSFQALIEKGHSIIVIEHNLDMIKCADYVIDIGPDGGKNGGNVVATGTPEEIVKNKKSITGLYLKEKLK